MKPSIPGFAAVLLLVALPLFAISATVVDDVISMSRAGVDTETILAFVHAKVEPFDISSDDIVAMKKAGVPSAVIKGVIDEAASRNLQQIAEVESPTPPAEQPPAAEEPESGTDVVIATAPIPDYLWDPWWYMPRLDTKSGAPAPAASGGASPAPRPAAPTREASRQVERTPSWVEGVARAVAAAAAGKRH